MSSLWKTQMGKVVLQEETTNIRTNSGALTHILLIMFITPTGAALQTLSYKVGSHLPIAKQNLHGRTEFKKCTME